VTRWNPDHLLPEPKLPITTSFCLFWFVTKKCANTRGEKKKRKKEKLPIIPPIQPSLNRFGFCSIFSFPVMLSSSTLANISFLALLVAEPKESYGDLKVVPIKHGRRELVEWLKW
jgi:hypothetical protein